MGVVGSACGKLAVGCGRTVAFSLVLCFCASYDAARPIRLALSLMPNYKRPSKINESRKLDKTRPECRQLSHVLHTKAAAGSHIQSTSRKRPTKQPLSSEIRDQSVKSHKKNARELIIIN